MQVLVCVDMNILLYLNHDVYVLYMFDLQMTRDFLVPRAKTLRVLRLAHTCSRPSSRPRAQRDPTSTTSRYPQVPTRRPTRPLNCLLHQVLPQEQEQSKKATTPPRPMLCVCGCTCLCVWVCACLHVYVRMCEHVCVCQRVYVWLWVFVWHPLQMTGTHCRQTNSMWDTAHTGNIWSVPQLADEHLVSFVRLHHQSLNRVKGRWRLHYMFNTAQDFDVRCALWWSHYTEMHP